MTNRMPQAWRADQIGGREAFTHRLSDEQISTLERLVAQTQDVAPHEITRERFSAPVIEDLMRAVKVQLRFGYGAMILSGLPMQDRSLDDFKRVHWGLATHLGEGVIQNVKGERIVAVRSEKGSASGVSADFELKPHSEFHEFLSLAAYSLPAVGGVSGLVSGQALFDEIARARPDVLPALEQGYYQASPITRTVSSTPVPVFSTCDGVQSVYYNRLFTARAAEERGEAFPEPYREAVSVLATICEQPGLGANFTLQPGEQLFWNNYINLHSRSAFEDGPGRERLLLRLWLRPPEDEARPIQPALDERRTAADRDYLEGFLASATGAATLAPALT